MKTSFKIAKNIPLPQRMTAKKNKYPFSEMKKGDSFLFDKYTQRGMAIICQHANYFCKSRKPKWKFCTRKTDNGMIRVWRIK